MESKKRSHPDKDDSAVSKKRIMTSANGSPCVNGNVHNDEDEPNSDSLELFRKEAIYRRMKHYCRENERNQNRIAELERRKSTCEAGLAAMSACWAQLVEAIRLLVKPDDLPQPPINAKEIFDLGSRLEDDPTPELTAALGDTMNTTQTLVTKFVQLGEGSQSRLLQGHAYTECQKAQTECVALKSQISIMRARLKDCETQREQYYSALLAAENRLERSRSGTVQAIEVRNKSEGAEDVKSEEPERKPSSPAQSSEVPIQTNGVLDISQAAALHEQLQSRENKIRELEHEAALLRDEKTILELNLKSPPLELFAENPHYKALLRHASVLEGTLAEKSERLSKVSEELGNLQAARKEWEDEVMNSANQATQELKNMLIKRDAENARLREQRDQQAAELNERKNKDSQKLGSVQEMKVLSESRSERITALESEVRRCKAQLAANAGQAELMQFFLDGNMESAEFFQSLKEDKIQAERRIAALEQTFSVYQDDHPDVVRHMKAEADALQKLSEVTSQLERYQKVYGDCSTLAPDVAQLAEQLKRKETELEQLRLSETQRAESEKSLFAELDKLSTAWEVLDRQLKSKIFDLASMEERVTKSGIDRAKSENKFYAAMRDKEAIENERKNLVRAQEKQTKAFDRFMATEKNLSAQVASLEKEIIAYKRTVETLTDRIHFLDKECNDLRAHAEVDKRRGQELFTIMNEREKGLQTKRQELRALEDNLTAEKRSLEKQTAQLKAMASSTPPSHKHDGDKDSEADNLRALLKCSTCRTNFRSVIITKCSHTFCKPCVDARISTRQRKCPACNLAFAQSDVQTIYWQ
ncbi:hypothetical protein BDQ12DRAFT_672875 [Crucibulum laeve]|uniref:E3 ubiquitin protein ligase n=1 Tax=Crucibulum laeve TaxID=68775 RepID=A0A5C3MGL5_9AGAR|nr:hypothetical protein BDQ12DRAFT_672875 [Crucibulum laeve]